MVHGIWAKPSLEEELEGVKLRLMWQVELAARVLVVPFAAGQSLVDSAKV
jgi:hypothetical protein